MASECCKSTRRTSSRLSQKKNVFLGRERAQIVSKAEQDFNFPSLAAVHKFILM